MTPRCTACACDMTFEKDRDTIDVNTTPGASMSFHRTGHPVMALIASALTVTKWVVNKASVTKIYKCPKCGKTETTTGLR